jgi:hypothetical protein
MVFVIMVKSVMMATTTRWTAAVQPAKLNVLPAVLMLMVMGNFVIPEKSVTMAPLMAYLRRIVPPRNPAHRVNSAAIAQRTAALF